MHTSTSILASGSETELVKLAFIAVVLVIGAIGSVVKRVREGQALPPLPNLARGAKPSLAMQRRMAAARPAPTVRPQTPPPAPRVEVPATRQPVAKPAAAAAPAVPLLAVKSLLNPTTVRAQFILAEVLQPPLALRSRKGI